MFCRIGVLGVCVASLCVALLFNLWGGDALFAQVQNALKDVKTATYEVTQTVGDQPEQAWDVKVLGKNLCRVDQPNGTYLVFDVARRTMMEVNPGDSQVRIIENLPVPKDYNVLAMLTDPAKFAASEQPGVPNREIGGVAAVGFVIEENGAVYNVWVDPKTKLPLEMEAERKVSLPDGEGGVKDQVVKEHWSNFSFNKQLDEKLFTLQPPEGFTVAIEQARTNKPSEQKNRALRAVEQAKAKIEAAKKKATEKK